MQNPCNACKGNANDGNPQNHKSMTAWAHPKGTLLLLIIYLQYWSFKVK